MYPYSAFQWIFFFYFYCFMGWIWESCYVSVRKRTWVNRGFLNGPWLPIYGFGVIIILLMTMPVRESLWQTYVVGMIGATVLEYVTGAVMEALFHMRYWDYSSHRFHLNGHICLSVSLGWGCFAVLLVWWLHRPFEAVILMIPETVLMVLDGVLTVLFIWDVTVSTKAALDIKKVLIQIQKGMERIADIERRMQEAALEHVQELKEARVAAAAEMSEWKSRYQTRFETLLRRNPSAMTKHYREGWKELWEIIKNRRG